VPNDVLRRALADAKLTPAGLASKLSVDPETVQRWVADEGRTPQPRHRWAVADALGVDEMTLWPNAARAALKTGPDREVQAVYPTRAAIPTELYHRMVAGARREIALCAYSYYGLWMRIPDLSELLRAKSEAGCRVRVTIGDPDSPVTRRIEEVDPEPLSWTRAIEFSRQKLEALRDTAIEVRQTDLAWGRSVYRFDDEAMVCLYVVVTEPPVEASYPYLHLRRRQSAGIFDALAVRHVEGVWEAARPVWE
jgi:hypothetical protein